MHLEDHTLPCVLYHHGEIDEVVPDSIARADSYYLYKKRVIISEDTLKDLIFSDKWFKGQFAIQYNS